MENNAIFISIPMKDKTPKEIETKFRIIRKELIESGYDVVDSILTPTQIEMDKFYALGLYYLGESLKKLAKCRYAYFCKGWENARGCKIEHMAAKAYGLELLYE